MPPTPHLRPVTAADDAFLFHLYASTRAEEVSAWGWSEAQRDTFLRMQWLAQQRGYEARFPAEGHRLVELEGQPVGRLWVVHGAEELRLVDVALLPAHRGSGLGTVLLQAVQQEARAAGKPLRLQVARGNPALRLYTRLGFLPMGEGEDPAAPYRALEWRAPRPGA